EVVLVEEDADVRGEAVPGDRVLHERGIRARLAGLLGLERVEAGADLAGLPRAAGRRRARRALHERAPAVRLADQVVFVRLVAPRHRVELRVELVVRLRRQRAEAGVDLERLPRLRRQLREDVAVLRLRVGLSLGRAGRRVDDGRLAAPRRGEIAARRVAE